MDGSDTSSNTNFFKYVFNFDSDSKSEMLNVIQYAIIAIIPMVVLIKTLKFVPEADENKSSLEIVAELVVYLIGIFIGLIFVHRIITYIPTYSGVKYPEFNVIFSILSISVTMISFPTKFGEKINILIERMTNLWEGNNNNKKTNSKNKKTNNNNNNNNNNNTQGQTPNQSAMNQSLYNDGTSINSLPTSNSSMSNSNSQQMPDYNNMYLKDTTPLVGAATPGQSQSTEGFSMEPMAANSVLGGGSFGSW